MFVFVTVDKLDTEKESVDDRGIILRLRFIFLLSDIYSHRM